MRTNDVATNLPTERSVCEDAGDRLLCTEFSAWALCVATDCTSLFDYRTSTMCMEIGGCLNGNASIVKKEK